MMYLYQAVREPLNETSPLYNPTPLRGTMRRLHVPTCRPSEMHFVMRRFFYCATLSPVFNYVRWYFISWITALITQNFPLWGARNCSNNATFVQMTQKFAKDACLRIESREMLKARDSFTPRGVSKNVWGSRDIIFEFLSRRREKVN